MQKIDVLGWADGVSFSAYGVRIGVRVSDAEALPAVRAVLPPGYQPLDEAEVDELVSYQVGGPGARPGIKRFHLVYAGAGRMARTHEPDEALHAIESSVQLLVALHATERVFIHAGVVAWRGRAILFPGRSFAGKSTLVAALLKAGAEYYSDEYAVLDEQGRVHPYPRRLSLRDGDAVTRQRPTAEELGSCTGTKPIPVGMVVMARFRKGAAWSPRSVSTSKAALALLDNAIAARKTPARCLEVISQVVTSAPCVTGPRGEADETAQQMLAACEWAMN